MEEEGYPCPLEWARELPRLSRYLARARPHTWPTFMVDREEEEEEETGKKKGREEWRREKLREMMWRPTAAHGHVLGIADVVGSLRLPQRGGSRRRRRAVGRKRGSHSRLTKGFCGGGNSFFPLLVRSKGRSPPLSCHYSALLPGWEKWRSGILPPKGVGGLMNARCA